MLNEYHFYFWLNIYFNRISSALILLGKWVSGALLPLVARKSITTTNTNCRSKLNFKLLRFVILVYFLNF